MINAHVHHFADAIEQDSGTVSYLRLIKNEGKVHCFFVIGKSRVLPLKKITVPHLELTAATVAVRTDRTLKEELDMEIHQTMFWTDSMSELRYINNTSVRFQTFVANRLALIHESSFSKDWHYINTEINPADAASRGMPIVKDLWMENWINPPRFLLVQEKEWPLTPKTFARSLENDPEVKCVKVQTTVTTQKSEPSSINRLLLYHSSWHKLKKSVAWILKIKKELLLRSKQKAIDT